MRQVSSPFFVLAKLMGTDFIAIEQRKKSCDFKTRQVWFVRSSPFHFSTIITRASFNQSRLVYPELFRQFLCPFAECFSNLSTVPLEHRLQAEHAAAPSLRAQQPDHSQGPAPLRLDRCQPDKPGRPNRLRRCLRAWPPRNRQVHL